MKLRPADAAPLPRPSPRSGSALVFAIGCFFFLFVLVLSVYSVGETVRRKHELQNACDAAAYSAAVVQADALSRMAVLNRAMAWSYIQCTKMQMDYITYKWLAKVRDSFREDMENIQPTGMDEFEKPERNREMGYFHFGKEGSPFRDYRGKWMSIHFSCHDHVHDNPDDSRARYIGLGPNTEGGLNALGSAVGAVTGGAVHPIDRHWIRINGFAATERRLEYDESTGDLNYVENGKVAMSRLVDALEDALGPRGAETLKAIDNAKTVVEYCGAMQSIVASGMGKQMTAAAQKTLRENLPRGPGGKTDPELLSDYAWSIVPGVSAGLPYDEKADGGYFSPLFNREEDEMFFLSMANGLPVDDNRVMLKDYFRSNTGGGSLAAGLDQWFVRADPSEFKKDKVGVYRNWTNPPKRIQRCYKTANYAEGAASGVLRGNYCLDGDSPRKPPNMSAMLPIASWFPAHYTPGSKWEWAWYGLSWVNEFSNIISKEYDIRSRLPRLIEKAPYSSFSKFALNADPSCINYRDRFHDQCANVNDTVGLVAEYEWATAYWFCCWIEFKRYGGHGNFVPLNFAHLPFCVHIPIPSAVFGGRNWRARYGGERATPAEIAAAQQPMFRPSRDKDARLSGTNLRGWKRSDYRRTFIGADAEPKYGCWRHKLEGDGDENGANMGAKGYVRIYGDDDDISDDGYVGPVATPFVLNQRYFNGAGTTIVGVARRQRNVFWWIAGKIGKGLGIYDAFSPDIRVVDGDGNEKSAGMPNLVAFSAARAAWAPRTGGGMADGSDSENNPARGIWGGLWGRHYELRYDTVTDGAEGNFEPRLHPNAPNGETLAKAARLGCVCGQDETGRRLRRQWNLCQTDWDAVLLPVRFAMSIPSRIGGSSGAAPADFDSGDDPDARTTWSYSDVPGDDDPQFKMFGWNTPDGGRPVAANMTWRRFRPDDAAPEPEPESYGEVVLAPQNMTESDAYLLFKKRMLH